MNKVNLWHYTLWLFAIRMLMPAVLIFISEVFGFDLSSSASSIVPAFVAAMITGQKFARANGRRLESDEAWRFALPATFIFIGVEAFATVTWGLLLAGPAIFDVIAAALYGSSGGLVIGLLVFLVAMVFVSNRVFVAMGAKNELKAIAKRAQKGQ